MSECPFHVGQKVVFKPDTRMLGMQVMSENLTVGETYTVSKITSGAFVRIADHETVGGGLHWSAFKPA